jgi:2-polyprenyl-3-methyl-5-hydroxy-6-metoxy-1,4-benzoquinol methylase
MHLTQPVLEMGFEEGTITEPLVRAGLTVEIVEGSEKLCENARQRFGEKVKVHCSYFENFNLPRKYKAVLSLHVLEHVDHPDEIASKMYEWVQPGGQVIAVAPNAESLHRQPAAMMGLQERNDSLSPRDKVWSSAGFGPASPDQTLRECRLSGYGSIWIVSEDSPQ